MGQNLNFFGERATQNWPYFVFSKVTWHCGSLNKYKVIHNQTGKQEMTSVLTVLKIL